MPRSTRLLRRWLIEVGTPRFRNHLLHRQRYGTQMYARFLMIISEELRKLVLGFSTTELVYRVSSGAGHGSYTQIQISGSETVSVLGPLSIRKIYQLIYSFLTRGYGITLKGIILKSRGDD